MERKVCVVLKYGHRRRKKRTHAPLKYVENTVDEDVKQCDDDKARCQHGFLSATEKWNGADTIRTADKQTSQ